MNEHQRRIEEFMRLAGQDVPDEPKVPDRDTRILRAELILEEALETISALGIGVRVECDVKGQEIRHKHSLDYTMGPVNMVEVADGCADVSVVTMGTLSAFGIDAEPVLEMVDQHNLQKFSTCCPTCGDEGMRSTGPSSVHRWCPQCKQEYSIGYRRTDGKWIKPKWLEPPDILGAIHAGARDRKARSESRTQE